ncbi:MAG: hypothetical protein AABY14_04015 [Nanoarchaeota archaeon]
MGELVDLIDKIKRYYIFTPSEIRGILVTILVIGFIISFREWGDGRIDIAKGIINLFSAILITGIYLFIHESTHRITALYVGLKAEYKPWTFGLLFGIIITFLTNGRAWILLPGGVIFHHLAGHRIGWWRYDIAVVTIGMLSLWGSLASLFFAIFLKIFHSIIPLPIIQKAMLLNIALALFTMLPIPPLNGSKVFYGGRLIYVFGGAFIVTTSILLLLDINPWISIISSFIVSIIAWLLFYILYEKDLWQGAFAGMRGR